MSNQLVRAATDPDPHRWRAGAVRMLVNALLVLLAFEVVSFGFVTATVIAGATLPVTPVELVPLLAVFLLVRWIFVLPGLLPVLVGIEYVARRVPHARVLTAIVAFAPMALWELTKSPGPFPSDQGAVLGVTAVVFAVFARLPARYHRASTAEREPAPSPTEAAVTPR